MRKKAFSGIMLIVLLFVSMLTLAFNIQPAKAIGIIYIRADGSIDPTTANITTFDNVTYTFTDNIYDEIVVERNNITIDGAGYTLQGTGMGTGTGIDMLDRSNVTIRNVEIEAFYYGIVLWASSNNSIFGNRVTNSTYAGVYLASSSNNTVSSNILTNNTRGVYLDGSFNNTISGNNITANNYFSIYLYYSFNNTVSGNNITANNGDGVTLYHSSSNTVSGNNVTNNSHGIDFGLSSNNRFYHNSFIDNTWQVFIGTPGYANSWDDGYPSGGNYWSDYDDTDLYTGPYQNETGSDGIGDTPYVIDENNQDNYPLMEPWAPAPPTVVATANVVPNTLNLKSKGEWITCYIELTESYNVSDIDIYSIRLNDTFPVSFLSNPPVPVPTEIGDYDNDGVPDLMVKFNRTSLTSYIYYTRGITYGNVSLTISGNLINGTVFEGTDTVKVMFGGDADLSGLVELDDYDIWLDNFGKKPNKCPPGLYPDFNNDGLVDMLDFFVWRENFGANVPPQP